MKMKKFMKKVLPILASGVIASTMAVSFMPSMTMTVKAANITWGDIKDTIALPKGVTLPKVVDATIVTEVTNGQAKKWNAGWYVVNSDVTFDSSITWNDGVNLILADNKTLLVNSFIEVNGNVSIWAQSDEDGTGVLNVSNPYYGNAIYSNKIDGTASVTINGGEINFTSTNNDGWGIQVPVTINGGTVVARGTKQAVRTENVSSPTLGSGIGVITASKNFDGTDPEKYSAGDIGEYKYLEFGKVSHVHTNHYGVAATKTANDTLTWYCDAGCPSGAVDEAHAVKLTLTADKNDDDNTYTIVFGTDEEQEAWENASLTVPTTDDFEIYKEDGKTPVESNIIKEAGKYKVYVKFGSDTVICTITIKGPEAPQPQQGAGSSVINTADLSGDINKINNKFVATAQVEVKSYLSASDFNKNKVEDTVTANVNATTNTTSTLTQAEKKAEEQQRYENFYTKMFNAKFSSTKEMTFLQKLLSAIYYTIDKIIK